MNPLFGKMIMVTLFPLALIIIFIIGWLLIWLCKRSISLKENIITSIVIVIHFILP